MKWLVKLGTKSYLYRTIPRGMNARQIGENHPFDVQGSCEQEVTYTKDDLVTMTKRWTIFRTGDVGFPYAMYETDSLQAIRER